MEFLPKLVILHQAENSCCSSYSQRFLPQQITGNFVLKALVLKLRLKIRNMTMIYIYI